LIFYTVSVVRSGPVQCSRTFMRTSVANQHHLDAVPDPTFHFDPDPDPACHFDADSDPDPIIHFDADPDPSFQIKAGKSAQGGSLILHTFWLVIFKFTGIRIQLITLMRIQIQLITLMRIRILPFNLMRIRIHNTEGNCGVLVVVAPAAVGAASISFPQKINVRDSTSGRPCDSSLQHLKPKKNHVAPEN
jgi:hypothetical protein